MAESIDTGAAMQDVLDRTAYQAGRTTGAATGTLLAVLEDAGYQPHGDEPGGPLILGNCPFHRLAGQFTALVCGVNLQLLRGVADGAGATHIAILDPSPGRCCVRLEPRAD